MTAESGSPARAAPRRAASAVLLAALAAILVLAPGAQANRTLEVSMQDDKLIRWGNAAVYLDQWKALGVEWIRINVLWRNVIAHRSTKPSGFEGWDHKNRHYNWQTYDQAILNARARGLKVFATITGPGPIWTSETPRRRRGAWKPQPLEFGRFAEAVADRYAEHVDRWGIYNEPNQGGWLQPQSQKTKRGWSLYAPHHYRHLISASYTRIQLQDPSARILIGHLAPSGRDDRGHTRPIRPLSFLRTFACLSHRYSRKRGGFCRGFRAQKAGGIAHHVHGVLRSPSTKSPNISDAALGDTRSRRLLRVLDKIHRRDGIFKDGKGRFSVWYAELAYQTDPPDPFSGITPVRQSFWMQEAQYEMWRQRRIRGWNQYIYVDDARRTDESGAKRFGGWESGLFFQDGRPKPYSRTYATPFWTSQIEVRSGRKVTFFGQYKPRPGQRIVLEYRNRGQTRWRELKAMTSNSAGYFFDRRRVFKSRDYRFQHPGGTSSRRTVRVD